MLDTIQQKEQPLVMRAVLAIIQEQGQDLVRCALQDHRVVVVL